MSENKTWFERIPAIMPVAVLIAALYAGWMFYSRWSTERETKAASEAREVERARKEVELNGGVNLKILSLYASPVSIARGQSAQLCYGVANAKNVRLDPAVADVWPSMSRCVDVSPKKTTLYTLIADDGAGHSTNSQIEIKVH